jgi:hypothetical protein
MNYEKQPDMVLWMKAQMGQLEIPENLANAIAAVFESSY